MTSSYDYDSIMHYPSGVGGLAKNPSVWGIRRKTSVNQKVLGGYDLSALDIQAVQNMY